MKIEFPPGFFARLERLTLMSRKAFAGRVKGERRSPRRGQSVEFADYRQYGQGDDFRHVDWHAYARLDNLFVKLFLEEQDLTVHLLVDVSRSMDTGSPNKFAYALHLAAAIGYMGLANLDRVAVSAFADGRLIPLRALHGKPRIFRLIEFLERIEPGGQTRFGDAVDAFLLTSPVKGVVIVLSDLLSQEPIGDALQRLKVRGYDPAVVQVLSPDELDPPGSGDWAYLDIETDQKVELTLSRAVVKAYRRRLNAYLEDLRGACTAYGIPYTWVSTGSPLDDVLLESMRAVQITG